MANYLESVEGKYFTDLSSDVDFQKDLVKFFTGSRYGMSIDEIKEYTPTELAEKFVEHMRWQSTNEVTALRDYNYVANKETIPVEELQAFGSLMTAYDKSEGGGTGALSGAWDYMSAFATSPSTLATIGTAGWGVGSKLAAKAGGKAAQIALRETISDLVKKGVATRAIQDQIAGTTVKGAVKGAAASAVVEGGLGAGQAYLQGETREVAAGTPYTTSDLLRDGLIAGTVGGTVGSVARAMDTKSQRSVIESLISRDAVNTARQVAADNAAKATMAATTPEMASSAADRAVIIATTLEARLDKTPLDPLDPKLVEKGNLLKEEILAGKTDRTVTANLSVSSLRSITAATLEIADKLDVKPNERISSAVARALEDGRIDGQFFDDLRENYNLSKEQLSYIYLADLSQAGKTLAEASYISRSLGGKVATTKAKADVKAVTTDLETLASRGINTIADEDAIRAASSVYKSKDGVLRSIFKVAQETDAMRIAFMTSQFGTTMANTASSTGRLLIDMSDQFWKSSIGATFGKEVEGKVQRRWVGGMLSTVKGMSWDKTQASLLREIFLEEQPEEYSRLFFEASRAEIAAESSSRMASVSRFVNILNSSVDSVFKEAVLYSSVDRSLRELNRPDLGLNLNEFLSKQIPLDSLPEDVMKRAVDDAKRYTFQRSYANDPSAFGRAAQGLINAHQNMPFVVSAGLGIPFPRYIANHLEHISDYTPIGVVTGGLNKLDDTLFSDPYKTGTDRMARQLTGASLILLGAYTAAQKEGEIDYDKIKTDTGVFDISRTAGPWLINFYLGDLYYRWKNDMPTDGVLTTMAEISVGVTDLGFSAPLLAEISKSAEEGEVTVGLARALGDIGATFTYPLTLSRDFVGQVDPTAITTPYTRDVFGGSTKEPELYGEGNFLDEVIIRATRFLPEWDLFQYTQTLNGKTAIPYYSPFSDKPIGSFDPLSKQFGFAAFEKPNEIQKEMSRLGFKEFDLYGSNKVANPAVDVAVRAVLGKTLPEKFVVWKSQVKHEGYGNMTYDEITDPDRRKYLFESFVNDNIRSAEAQIEDQYKTMLVDNPRAAAGYIRNLYVISEKRLVLESGDKQIYDSAVRSFTEGAYTTAADYLGDSDSIEEELTRRQAILKWATDLTPGYTPLPSNQFK